LGASLQQTQMHTDRLTEEAHNLIHAETVEERFEEGRHVLTEIGTIAAELRVALFELENKLAHFPTAREGSPFARVTDREFQQVISKLSGVVSTDRHHPGTLAAMELDVKDVLKRLTEMEREGGHDESGEHDARLDVL